MEFKKEVEYEQMRLAACGVAAMSNTEETIKDRLTVEHEYHSGSYDSVCAAVDREMKYREQLREAEELVEKIWVIYGEYYSTLMDDKIFTTKIIHAIQESEKVKK